MASYSKKPRVEPLDFSNYPTNLIREVAKALDGLCFETSRFSVTLRPLKIMNSNAADGCPGAPFSKAYCCVDETNKLFMFGDIFRRGLDVLTDFLVEKKMPNDKAAHFVLCKLLSFLADSKDNKFPVENPERFNEIELTILFANHLFGRLSTSSNNYIIDEKRTELITNKCICCTPFCRLTGTFGDTSIGNGEVWHGNLDVIFNDDLGIEYLGDGPVDRGKKFSEEVKLKSIDLTKSQQLISETVVLSFLQQQRHPERDHFLTPCIGVGSSELVVMFYDSEYDVLLESSRIPFFDSLFRESTPGLFSVTAILVAWLVVNYRYLCSGLTQDMESAVKADFGLQAKQKLEVYKSGLKYQNIDVSTRSGQGIKTNDTVVPSMFTFLKHQRLSKVIFLARDSSNKKKMQ